MSVSLLAQGQPGNIVPYELSEEEEPEILLTPVTKYAVQESEEVGPLKQRELILLLSQKFDRRLKRTVDVVRTYAKDVDGVKNQLENLRNRIQEIETIESLRSEFLHKRIRKVLTGNLYFCLSLVNLFILDLKLFSDQTSTVFCNTNS